MVDTIEKEELKQLLDSKSDFLLFDVRDYAGYLELHIDGAKSLPVNEIDKEVSNIDKSKLIVVYCGGTSCPLSGFAWEKLHQLGCNVKAYEGGIAEWKEAEYPTASG